MHILITLHSRIKTKISQLLISIINYQAKKSKIEYILLYTSMYTYLQKLFNRMKNTLYTTAIYRRRAHLSIWQLTRIISENKRMKQNYHLYICQNNL